MDKDKERNSFTGMPMVEHDDSQELNPLTGTYFPKEKDDESVSKSDDPLWPSISDIDKRDVEDPEPEQVSKSSDERPWPSMMQHLVGDVSNDEKSFEKAISMNVPIVAAIEKSADERIVYGIVYEPDVVDAQGDQANAEEIKKAAYHFMENNPTFKIMHKGKPVNTKVLESFIAPDDYTIEKRKVKKGSWVLVTRILDKKLWKDIKSGKFTGYSMAGYAKVEEN